MHYVYINLFIFKSGLTVLLLIGFWRVKKKDLNRNRPCELYGTENDHNRERKIRKACQKSKNCRRRNRATSFKPRRPKKGQS